MTITDSDIGLLVQARCNVMQLLKLEFCSGFSTDGLKNIARSCRYLRTLSVQNSKIDSFEKKEWLGVLATNNTVLMHLNFYLTELIVSEEHLELLVCNCKNLISLKISECDLALLDKIWKSASNLEEFGGGLVDNTYEVGKYNGVVFPPRLVSIIGPYFMDSNVVSIVHPRCSSLKTLQLVYTLLNTEELCELITKCYNLEDLEVRHIIRDIGLQVVGNVCKKLRRLRIESGDEDLGGSVTQVGLISIARNCLDLEYIAVYADDISNDALAAFGQHSSKLRDFRLVVNRNENHITEVPLNQGIRAFLMGCTKLERLYFSVRPGELTDVGLGYIGECSKNITYMYLGHVGQSDLGLLYFSLGCQQLRKLDLMNCPFTEQGLALAIINLPKLRYVWVKGFESSPDGEGFQIMKQSHWNIEFIPSKINECKEVREEEKAILGTDPQLLAYYSLAGKRTDYPNYVVPLFQS